MKWIRCSSALEWGILAVACTIALPSMAQSANQEDLARQVQQLTSAIARTQKQLEQSQQELMDMRRQLSALKEQLAQSAGSTSGGDVAAQLSAQVKQLREQQQLQESQIATHEQSKVESSSKYPVALNGLILLNGFVNTAKVDLPATPTIALWGAGSSGATLRQTLLGFDAQGPRLFGARSYGDIMVDFLGSAPDNNYPGGGSSVGLLRLHTAHAGLDWGRTRAWFSYDRPLISPNAPTSLTATAIPPLAWSGNLWNWNPQIGVRHDLALPRGHWFRAETALIDAADPPAWLYGSSAGTPSPRGNPAPSSAEQSHWPGVETRLSWLANHSIGRMQRERTAQFGIGGYFAPHKTYFGANFDAWAGTLDFREPLPEHLQLSGQFYRGLGLGGLGGGAYKDVAFVADPDNPGNFYYRALDDIGGWAQLKERPTERIEFNAAFGIDNVPAGQLRDFSGPASAYYLNLTRNRTYTGNVIYSPSAYLLFSLEYRRLDSSTVTAPTASSNIIGLAAGYKF